MSGSQGMHSPVAQFEIKPLIELSFGGYDLSFTNSSLFMMLAIGVSAAFLISAMRGGALVPGRMQGLAEMMYEFVAEMVRSNVGHEGRPYFPFIFTLFVFLLFGNMLGTDPLFLHLHIANCCDLRDGGFCLRWCNAYRIVQAWVAFLQLLCASRRAESADPIFDCD